MVHTLKPDIPRHISLIRVMLAGFQPILSFASLETLKNLMVTHQQLASQRPDLQQLAIVCVSEALKAYVVVGLVGLITNMLWAIKHQKG